jgi:hypothetical protein
MSNFQHTPGPWEYQWEDYRYVIMEQRSIGKAALAVTAGSYPKSVANAQMISAAPDMFAALNMVLSHWQSDYLPQGWEPIRDAVRAARNKADPTGALKEMTALDDEMESGK